MNLTDLKSGEKGRISNIESTELTAKLLEMGCLPGEEVEVEHTAPFGGPIAVRVLGYSLGLRKTEARQILVERLD